MLKISPKVSVSTDLEAIQAFLGCKTPDVWVETALKQQDIMLIDHAHCEKKAASTALSLIFTYPDKFELGMQMSKLAREELRHYEQVMKLMAKRDIQMHHLPPAAYGGKLRKACKTHEPDKLIDILIVGAFIEARSCERFAAVAPHLDAELQQFYGGLLACEAKHYRQYLDLAALYAADPKSIPARITHFREVEAGLILAEDEVFRFHSGAPIEIDTL